MPQFILGRGGGVLSDLQALVTELPPGSALLSRVQRQQMNRGWQGVGSSWTDAAAVAWELQSLPSVTPGRGNSRDPGCQGSTSERGLGFPSTVSSLPPSTPAPPCFPAQGEGGKDGGRDFGDWQKEPRQALGEQLCRMPSLPTKKVSGEQTYKAQKLEGKERVNPIQVEIKTCL